MSTFGDEFDLLFSDIFGLEMRWSALSHLSNGCMTLVCWYKQLFFPLIFMILIGWIFICFWDHVVIKEGLCYAHISYRWSTVYGNISFVSMVLLGYWFKLCFHLKLWRCFVDNDGRELPFKGNWSFDLQLQVWVGVCIMLVIFCLLYLCVVFL